MTNHKPQQDDSFLKTESLPIPKLAAPTPLTHLSEAIKHLPVLCSGRLTTEQSLETFFKLLYLSDIDRQASYRLKFWQTYLHAGLIHQAWIILAQEAEKIATSQLNLKKHQFARLAKNRRVDDVHAVLLMRVGELVIAEWSHAGKCRFWHQQNPHVPIFFKRLYKRDELIDYADYIQQHYFSAKGLWQKDAALWMQNSGITMQQIESINP